MKRVIAFPARILAASWGQAFSALVLLVTIRLFTQELGPEPFGAAMLGLGIISLVDGVSTTAYSQSLAQILKDRPTHERRSLALGMGLWLSAFVGVLCAAGVVLAGIAYGWQSAAAVALVAPAFCLAEGVRAGGQMIVLLGRRYGVVSSWAATEALCIAGRCLRLEVAADHAVELVEAVDGGQVEFGYEVGRKDNSLSGADPQRRHHAEPDDRIRRLGQRLRFHHYQHQDRIRPAHPRRPADG